MRVRRGVVAALLTAAAFAGCTDVSTDPQFALSLQFDSLPASAVVIGDTMRGADLAPARLGVRAFSGAGTLLNDSALRVIGIDSTSVASFQMIGGLRLTGRKLASAVRVVSQAGSLQSQQQTFAVVPVPTSLRDGDSIPDTLFYTQPDSAKRFRDVKVTIVGRTAPESTLRTLEGLRVKFRVVSFADSVLDSVRLVSSASGRLTTSALISGGSALVRIKAYPKAGPVRAGSIIVEAAFNAFGANIPGSPFLVPITLRPFTPPP